MRSNLDLIKAVAKLLPTLTVEVDPDAEVDGEGVLEAYSIDGYRIYFGPSEKTPGTNDWSLHAVQHTPATRWEPDDFDLVEMGIYAQPEQAAAAAVQAIVSDHLNNILEGIFWERDREEDARLVAEFKAGGY